MTVTLTPEIFKAIAPSAAARLVPGLLASLPVAFEKFEINTLLRAAHFVGQCAHESAGFKTLTEYASGRAYEGRKDLGNLHPGDGVRYKGRGIIMLTGRANYRLFGKEIGVDLESNPLLAADPKYAAQTAGEYWKSRGLNRFADADDIRTITKRINGGFNGLADRILYTNRAKKALAPLFTKPTPTA